jgi:hypothetical protein
VSLGFLMRSSQWAPAAVPQFQVRKLAFLRVGGEAGEPVPVKVGEPQLRPGGGRSVRTMTRIPAGRDDRLAMTASLGPDPRSQMKPP